MAVPGSRGPFREQAEELFAQVRCIVERQSVPLVPTTLMVFLRDATQESLCRELVRTHFADAPPVTTVVTQPPCCGAELGIELWALGGPGVLVERFGPDIMTARYDDMRWVYCGGIQADTPGLDAYAESLEAFDKMRRRLSAVGASFDQVVRTWIYVNRITDRRSGLQRYQEFNRARSDFYRDIPFGTRFRAADPRSGCFPASTGIGTRGPRIQMACVAIDSRRSDVFVVPLENPQQTPAYDYQPVYSPESPKFSRGVAVVQGRYVSLMVSGTASIVDSRTVYPGDVVRQTVQTLNNIERLIAPENLARLGLPGAGATLKDVAKLRVYVKHAEDYPACRNIVEHRLPKVPAIYLDADVCRPDLLVEIEAVAFSPYSPAP